MDAGLKKQIDGLLEEAEKGSLLQSMEKIYAILRDHGLMWSSTVHSRWIGVHESNRDGTGISPDHVQKLCLDFFEFGYVPSASRRICIELGTGDRCSDDTRAYNDKLVQQSNNLLPPIKDKLRFATIAGSHSNQVMRMWFYGMEHASEKLTTGGRLSSEILQRSDSLYWQAVHQGVEWEIISSLVPATWKHFASLASSAANSAQQVSQGETDLQVCKKIASTWQACNAGNVMTYQEMKPILLRSKPPRTETIPHLFSFMMKCGGGATGHLMQATESFVRCNGISSRRLPVQAWDYLATDVKNKQGEQAVLWRHAMLKTMYCVENGLTPGDIKKSFSNGSIFQQVLVFERTHQELRKLGASMSELSGHMLAQGLGVFEVDSVMAILGKKFKGPHECRSINTIGIGLSDFTAIIGKGQDYKCQLIRDISEGGRLTSASIVLDAGFDVGSKIVRKSDNKEATIKEMSSIRVVVTCDDGKDYDLKVDDLIGGKWKHQPKEKAPELVKDPEVWKELLKMGVMRADVIKRIHETVQQCPDQLKGLDLIQKPKGVSASSDFGKGKLKDHGVFLLPPNVPVPFWMMKTTDSANDDEANMELVKKGNKMFVARNTQAVSAGDPLVLVRDDMAAAKKPEPLQPATRPLKRQRKTA
ncbi:unnamed protein product [Cladocopium goreaui]|uniref:Uncharacterized protein n=1 Tax=Cladocopium goreaui TaxID=2562237 RepID=A0A9P1GCU6_9DINO|nr:unnamed protein product [Cladocopium goreaui]